MKAISNCSGSNNKIVRDFLEESSIADIRSLPRIELQIDDLSEYKSMSFNEVKKALSDIEDIIHKHRSNV